MYLKLGVNHYKSGCLTNNLAKVWGETSNQWVIHDFMSLQTYNYQFSYFIGKCKDVYEDPFQPHIKLDFFNRYMFNYYMSKIMTQLKNKMFTETKGKVFSEIKLSD